MGYGARCKCSVSRRPIAWILRVKGVVVLGQRRPHVEYETFISRLGLRPLLLTIHSNANRIRT